jgi:hypothetical protein
MTYGQPVPLKSVTHGLKMMNEDVPKETIIGDIKFQDGADDTVSVVRFDNVELGLYPLIVSRKIAVTTDSLGLLSFKLAGEPLENFLWFVDNFDPKFHRQRVDGILLRVTYRINGEIKQYYITDRKITTAYLLTIEKQLNEVGDPNVLEPFYKFVSSTGLIKSVRGKIVWVVVR